MTLRQTIETLSAHADSLRSSGVGPASPLPASTLEAGASLQDLMHLARRLHDTLAPVDPRPEFIATLGAQLATARPAAVAARAHERAREKEHRLRWAAGLGGALYLASLGFVSFRAAQAVTGRVAALAAARTTQANLPKATIAT